MQTFLPYPDFRQSAAVLDNARLGKQRVEALQVLRALVIPSYGWQTHPAVRMWMGHVPAMTMYSLAMVDEWTQRGHADNTRQNITEFAPQAAHPDYAAKIPMPYWLGEPALHLSHQSKLVHKDPKFYGPLFKDAPPNLDYFWPDPRHEFIPEDPVEDVLWILRSPHPEVDPETLTTVALPPVVRGKAAAPVPDPDGYSPVYVEESSRRPTQPPRKLPPVKEKKPTRKRVAQEEAFRTLPGNTDVAVELDGGARYALGKVHGRPITLDDGRFGRNFTVTSILDRAAFDYPARLQDPRVFFPVPAP